MALTFTHYRYCEPSMGDLNPAGKWVQLQSFISAVYTHRMANSVEDVEWFVTNFLEKMYLTSTYQPKICADLVAASSSASLGSFTP